MTNYTKGRAKEYRILDKLRLEGFEIVFRSAGSHSKIDCIGIHRDGRIKLIQSKPKSMSDNKKKEIADDLSWLNRDFKVTVEVL